MPDLINTTVSISGLLALQIYDICPNKYEKNFRKGFIDFFDNTLSIGIPRNTFIEKSKFN